MEPLEGNMPGASEPDPVSTKQQRIAQLAQQAPSMGFFSLAHHIDLRWLYEAYLRVRKNGATGVVGQTPADNQGHPGATRRSRRKRAKSGSYRAPRARRAHNPKGTGAEPRQSGMTSTGA